MSRQAIMRRSSESSCLQADDSVCTPAVCSQLFIVVEGEGVVLTDHAEPTGVSVGTIVWWKQDELHETQSEMGLVAIVIEADSLAPALGAAAAN
jgi:hypothetical protein